MIQGGLTLSKISATELNNLCSPSDEMMSYSTMKFITLSFLSPLFIPLGTGFTTIMSLMSILHLLVKCNKIKSEDEISYQDTLGAVSMGITAFVTTGLWIWMFYESRTQYSNQCLNDHVFNNITGGKALQILCVINTVYYGLFFAVIACAGFFAAA